MMKWTKTTEEKYWEMLGMLPPAAQTGLGFLVGEPMDHGLCTVRKCVLPRFSAFVEIGEAFYESVGSMTSPEFKALTSASVLANVEEKVA